MVKIPRFAAGLAAASALVCISLAAQTTDPAADGVRRGSPIIQHDPPLPFPPGRASSGPAAIEFRASGQMTGADRELEAGAEPSIAARAGIANLEFNRGEWTYQQIVCPALPDHLLLRFTRDNGPRDQTVFTASIPRHGQGHVRVIPLIRRGYSLWSPAPVNANTIAAFNQIRREEGVAAGHDWLETGLCYAALAGASPVVGALTPSADLSATSGATPGANMQRRVPPFAEMEIPAKGGAIVRFTDQGSVPHPTLWTMTFSPGGILLKVQREPASAVTRWQVPSEHSPQAVILPTPHEQPVISHPIELHSSAPASTSSEAKSSTN